MIEAFFNAEIIAAIWPIVLAGLLNTVLLSLIVVPLGLLGGLVLALLASVRHPLVRWPLMAWVDFFRDPVLWRDIERGIGIQLVYLLVLLGAAWANFLTKDVAN